jgi:riboflavin kinase/FMN adenylyltransferase
MSAPTTTGSAAERREFAVYSGHGPLPGVLERSVAAIGNFDGLHRGHQAVLNEAKALAHRMGRPATLLTFDPHPRLFFRPDAEMFRLTPGDLKLAVARRLGLDGALVLPFDAELAGTSASDFVKQRLVRDLHLSGVVVGHDFHFGRGREGSPSSIATLGTQAGLVVEVVAPLKDHDELVSSSAIRDRLREGDAASAGRLLGYRWIVRSVVQHGEKRGRELGYPTANLRMEPDCGLRHGIYAVRMAVDGVVHGGVASFGRRPTFDNGAPLLEVHLFDFAGDLYGRVADVEFLAWIRGEEKFSGIEPLIAQMDRDSTTARAALDAGARGEGAPSLLPLGDPAPRA